MEETTTPEAPAEETPAMTADESGVSSDEATPVTGEETTEETSAEGSESTTQTPANEAAKVSEDDEIEAWAKSQNLDLNKPEDAKKLAKRFKDTQTALHEKTNEQKLRKTVEETALAPEENDELTPIEKELARQKQELVALRMDNQVNQFYLTHPEAKALDAELAKIAEEKPWLINDLETLLLVAQSRQPGDTETARAQGRTEALKSVDTKVRASAPAASASTGESSKPLTDEAIRNMSLEEYKANREEILKTLR